MTEQNLDATSDDGILVPELGSDTPEIESESSPELAAKPEENNDNPFQVRIDKVTGQKYEHQRRADTAESRVRELEAQLEKPAVVDNSIERPKLPEDLYDREAMEKYHSDVVEYSAQVATAAGEGAFEKQKQAGTVAQQTAERQQVVSTYASNAVRDGVDMDKLRAAEQMLNQSGISPELGQFLMKDPNGGKIVEFLHDNPSVLHDVLSLDPISAGHKILTEVKPRALSTTPKVSNAPEPIPDIRGGGATDKDDFERTNPGTTFI